MAVTIIDIDSNTFSIDGITYQKHFMSVVNNDNVQIMNVYDSTVITVPYTDYTEFTIDGGVFASAELLQTALVPVLFRRVDSSVITDHEDLTNIGAYTHPQIDAHINNDSIHGEYKGTYNASTNTPTLVDGTGIALDTYYVDVAGTQDLGSGSIDFSVGDLVVYVNDIWIKIADSEGFVTLDTEQTIEGEKTFDNQIVVLGRYISAEGKYSYIDGQLTGVTLPTNVFAAMGMFGDVTSDAGTETVSIQMELETKDTYNLLADQSITPLFRTRKDPISGEPIHTILLSGRAHNDGGGASQLHSKLQIGFTDNWNPDLSDPDILPVNGTIRSEATAQQITDVANDKGVTTVEWFKEKLGLTFDYDSADLYVQRVLADGGSIDGKAYDYLAWYLANLEGSETIFIPAAGYKEGTLYGIDPRDYSSAVNDFTFTRSFDNATRINEFGERETMLANVPRIDYTNGVPEILLEPATTNLYSNPDTLVTQDVTTVADDYTVAFEGAGTITFTGTYSGSLVGIEGQRVSLTFTATAGTLTSTVSGDVTFAQIENLTWASSYVIGTRGADLAINAGDTTTISSEEGVLMYEGITNFVSGESSKTISITDGTNNNRADLYFFNNNGNSFSFYRNNSVNEFQELISSETTNVQKLAYSWKQDEFKNYYDGAQTFEQLTGNVMPTNTLNNLSLAQNGVSSPFYGRIRQIRHLPDADIDLEELTTPSLLSTLSRVALKDIDNYFSAKQTFQKGIKHQAQTIQPNYEAGLQWFDGVNHNLYDNIPNTSIQIGKELVVDVYNDNGSTITNFTAVRYDSSVNGVPTVVRAQADTVANAIGVAIATHDIGVDDPGKVTTHGTIGGDTSSWAVDDSLFLSATVAGEITNVEQPILKYVGRVLVSATEENGGKILVSQRPIINVTAVGQVGILASSTQSVSTTPAPLEVYRNTNLIDDKNVTITQTGSSPYTAEMSPTSVGASGLYRVAFNITIESGTNAIFFFEVYVNDVATGVFDVVDLSNANTDSGGASFNAITTQAISNTDDIKIYVYCDSGTPTFTAESGVLNIERIGNV